MVPAVQSILEIKSPYFKDLSSVPRPLVRCKSSLMKRLHITGRKTAKGTLKLDYAKEFVLTSSKNMSEVSDFITKN